MASSIMAIDVPSINLIGMPGQINLNCLMLSPLQLAGLQIASNLSDSTEDNSSAINLVTTNVQTGAQSETPIFTGHNTNPDHNTNVQNAISKLGLIKLIKTITPILSTISYNVIDGIIFNCQEQDNITTKVFDNMRLAIATCGSSSRYYNRCYLTGHNYTTTDNTKVYTSTFSGAKAIYGDGFYLISMQYAAELEHIFPIADAYFNLTNNLLPLQYVAPKLVKYAQNKNYVTCQIRRTSGNVQSAIIKIDRYSMISYKFSADGTKTIPYVMVCFKANGCDVMIANTKGSRLSRNKIKSGTKEVDKHAEAVEEANEEIEEENEENEEDEEEDVTDFNDCKSITFDSYKTIKVTDLLAENPELAEYFDTILEGNFAMLTLDLLASL